MPYYNPLSSQQGGNQYYDPHYNSQQQDQSVGNALGTLAKTMVVMGALNMVGQAGTKWLSRKAGRMIQARGTGRLKELTKGMTNPTIGGIVKKTNTYKKIARPLKKTSIYQAGKARQQRLSSLKGKPGYGAARLTSAFKNPKTLLSAAIGTWKQNVLSGIGVAYAVDSLLGVTTRDLGLEKKKWYDVPGHASNFGKWLVNDSIAGLAMGGAMRAGGALGSAGMMSLRRTFSGKFGQKVMGFAASISKPAIREDFQYELKAGGYRSAFIDSAKAGLRSNQDKKFASSVVKNALHFARNIPSVMRSASTAIRAVPASFRSAKGTPRVRTKKALNTVKAAVKGALAAASEKEYSSRGRASLEGVNALKAVHELAKKSYQEAGASAGQVSLLTPEFKKHFLDKIEHANNKKSFLQETFSFLKPLKNKDIVDDYFWQEQAERLSTKYVKGDVDIFLSHIKNMRVGSDLFVGTNAKGGGVDLSLFNPVTAMKRAASPVANMRIHVHLTNWDFTVGDITGLNSLLADRPTFDFFKNKTGIALENPSLGQVTIDDLAEGSSPLTMYMDGGFAVFDGVNVRAASYENHRLKYTPRGSRQRRQHITELNKKRWELYAAHMAGKDDPTGIDKEKAAAFFNEWKKKWEHRDAPKNKFLNFLNTKLNLTLPNILERMASSMDARFRGDPNDYKNAVSSLFNDDVDAAKLYGDHLPFLKEAYQKGTQVFAKLLPNKDALTQIGMSLGAEQRKDIVGIAFNNAKLSEALDTIDWRVGKYRGRADFQRAAFDIKVNPSYASSHHATKRMGNLSEMTSYDIARTNMIEDIFNSNFDILSGNGRKHPLVDAIPQLLEQGHINQQDANALSMWAKLSAFRDKGLFSYTGDPDNAKSFTKFNDILKDIRDRGKVENWNLEQEVLRFSRDYGIKRPSIRGTQQEILPKELGQQDFISTYTPYIPAKIGAGGRLADIARGAMDATTDMLGEVLPFQKRQFTHHGIAGNLRYVGNIIGVTAASAFAYRTVDTLAAANPLFEDTALDDGITGITADTVAKARLGLAHVNDLIGVTDAAKYLHGLAPKSESFVPGAFLGTIAGMTFGGPLTALKYATLGGLANRLASPYLPDITKSHEELKAIYSGEEQVPMMKSPTWLLGGTPWEGTKVEAYVPNWYVRAKSRWEESDTLYGGPFRRLIHKPLPLLGTNIGDIIDPYYLERKSYWSRPYLETGKAFDEVPIIGSALAATIGRIIKPPKTMHQEFLYADQTQHGPSANSPFAITPPSYGTSKILMQSKSHLRNSAGITSNDGQVVLPKGMGWSERASEDFLYDIESFAGLKGFMAGTMSDRIFGQDTVMPTLEHAGRIASMSRSYYDKNLGGMFFISEPIRRLIDKPQYRQMPINPIPNMMPQWVGQRFTTGDPFIKIKRGELRLPGEAYARTHPDVRHSFPGRASMLGSYESQMLQYFTGTLSPFLKEEYDILETGTEIHEQIQDHLAAEGLLVQAEALVHDVKNDITGHIDAIIRDGQGGRGKRALEIKTISEDAIWKLDGPKYSHVGQLNFYLKELGLNDGSIMYVARENPAAVRVFNVRYSEDRWQKDLMKLRKVRGIAADMLREGIVDTRGHSYSWLDRLSILADVNPASKEFAEAKKIVQDQLRAGKLTQKEISKYKKALSHRQARLRNYELFPRRFTLDKMFSPDTQYNTQSINTDIKADSEYSLPSRAIGYLWEEFTNSNNILSNKLFAVKDPLEHYKMTRIYGKEYKPWDEPIRSWLEPYSRGLASKTGPIEGALGYGMGGFVLGGGPAGAVVGALGGAAYGTAHGLYRWATGTTYIPNVIEDRRQLEGFFDAAKYERLGRLAALSEGTTKQELLKAQETTLTGLNMSDEPSVANLFRASPYTEKPYVEAFLNERDPSRRKEILNYVPKDLGKALANQWRKHDESINTDVFVNETSKDIAAGRKTYAFNEKILDPRVPLEDIKLKTLESQAYDVHEHGLGWNEQMLRVQNNFNEIEAVKRQEYNNPPTATPTLSSSQVRSAISNLINNSGLKGRVNVYINNGRDGPNSITINIRRDRALSALRALKNRESYINGRYQ